MFNKIICLVLIMGMCSGICAMQPPIPSALGCLNQGQNYLYKAVENNFDNETIDIALIYLDQAKEHIDQEAQYKPLLLIQKLRTYLKALLGEAYFLKTHIPHIHPYDKNYYITEAWYYLMQTAHQNIFPKLQVKAQYQISKLYMLQKDIPNAQRFLQFVAQQDIDLELRAKARLSLPQIEERLRRIEKSLRFLRQIEERARWYQSKEESRFGLIEILSDLYFSEKQLS